LTSFDKILLVVGTTAAIIAGAILPSISLVMGNVAAAFTDDNNDADNPQAGSTLMDAMSTIAAIVMMIAMALFVFSYVFFAFWNHLAENITLDLRKRYIRALMSQEIGYFEINRVEQIPVQISEIFDTVKSSIGEKISNLIFAGSTCCFGMIYALVYGPLYALCCIAYLPFFIAILAIFGKMV
jgi:ATP-binding cassette subfamily B (MDR/TAP) protein 1